MVPVVCRVSVGLFMKECVYVIVLLRMLLGVMTWLIKLTCSVLLVCMRWLSKTTLPVWVGLTNCGSCRALLVLGTTFSRTLGRLSPVPLVYIWKLAYSVSLKLFLSVHLATVVTAGPFNLAIVMNEVRRLAECLITAWRLYVVTLPILVLVVKIPGLLQTIIVRILWCRLVLCVVCVNRLRILTDKVPTGGCRSATIFILLSILSDMHWVGLLGARIMLLLPEP